jgi:hypothetical protein
LVLLNGVVLAVKLDLTIASFGLTAIESTKLGSIEILDCQHTKFIRNKNMANIELKDLTDLDSSIRELSESELVIQGGKRQSSVPTLPAPILSDWPTPIDSFIPPHLPGFYI